jgi:predicted MFS family arabinose efflux permease
VSARNYLLAFGAFGIGTSGYVVAGVLPDVAGDLHVTASAAGQLVTAFAIAYAIASPVLGAVTGHWERRRLLIAAMIVAAAGNALSAVVTTYPALFGARMLTALGAAVYTPVASGVAAGLAEPGRRARDIALVFGGLTISLIIGVPAGSLLGAAVGYRGVFAVVALLCLAAAAGLRWVMPLVSAPAPVSLRDRLAVAVDRRIGGLLMVMLLGCTAAFSVYTFIRPLFAETSGVQGGAASLLLMVYGVGAAVGNWVGGRAADRFGSRVPLLIALGAAAVVLAAMPVALETVPTSVVVLAVWGAATWSTLPVVQHALLTAASPTIGPVALSLNASAIYLGVGLASAIGGVVLRVAGPLALGPVAAVLCLVALGVVVRARSEERVPVAA